MSDLSSIIAINPIRPSSGPLSQASGPGMAIQSLAGMTNPQMGFMIVSEALQSLYGQLLTLFQMVGKPPTVDFINFPFLLITDLTLASNSPTAGNIAWTPCTVYYNGKVYGISAGNTTGGNKLVWWVVGDDHFTSGNSFTPNATTFDIASNTSGTADNNWSKIGANGIQSSQVLGGLLPPGYQVQAPATANIGNTITTTIINYSGPGALLSVGFSWSLSTVNTGPPNGGAYLSISVDGSTAQVYQITTPAQPSVDPVNQAWGLAAAAAATVSGNPGLVSFFNIPFNTSLLVQVIVEQYFSGNIQVAAGWAKKV